MDFEPEAEDIYLALSKGEQETPSVLSRRRFLQAIGLGGAMAAMPGWMEDVAAAATPLRATDGIVVVVQLGGGNDGLNTLIPTSDGKYVDLRRAINLRSSAISIADGVGLHPSLPKLAARYRRGQVAAFRGVGVTRPNLSHFTSTATWMSGSTDTPRNGWLGRYLDGLPNANSLNGIAVGSGVPLTLVGSKQNVSALPVDSTGLYGTTTTSGSNNRLFDGIASFGRRSRGHGALADKWGACELTSMQNVNEIAPAYPTEPGDGKFGQELQVCARLINANLGMRVFHVDLGSFDTHANELESHAQLLAELDNGIDGFFNTLSPNLADQVTLMTFSEFGRRASENASGGTDHGTASCMFVMGKNVRGGIYGDQPSLVSLDDNHNLSITTDFRAIYASVLDRWLKADSTEILGTNMDDFDLFVAGPGKPLPSRPPDPGPGPGPGGTDSGPGRPAYRLVAATGSIASFGTANLGAPIGVRTAVGLATTPARDGFWIAGADGGVFTVGSAEFYGSMGGKPLNSPVVGITSTPTGKGYLLAASDGGLFAFGDAVHRGSMGGKPLAKPVVGVASTPSGRGYWMVASDGGIFAFGDAPFHGNTRSFKLNQPIVGMASSPSGNGYWLTAADGGVFAFGDAAFFGSLGNTKLNKPIVSITASSSGRGYRLAAEDGGVFCFGDAVFSGSATSTGAKFVGIAE